MELHEAFVLHTRPWRDTSLLVDLFVREQGRVRAIAKGVRRQSGKKRGNDCQPFRALNVSYKGRSSLRTLVGIEPAGALYDLAGQRLYAGMYANELLLRALHEYDPHPDLFDAYARLLGALSEVGGQELEPPLRIFELTLLEEAGYGIDFQCDAAGGDAIEPGLRYQFVAEAGFMPVAGASQRSVFMGADILAIGEGRFHEPVVRKAAKRLMREALIPLIGDKPLNSRALFTTPMASG